MAGLNDPHLIPADAIVHNSCRGPGFAHTPMKISLRYRDENSSPLPGAGQLRGHALAEGFGAERPAEIGGARGRIGNHALQRVVDGGGRVEQRVAASSLSTAADET